jgi:hypothetical protein
MLSQTARRLENLQRKLRGEVVAKFSSASNRLGDSTKGMKGKTDTVSRAKMVNTVLGLVEALHPCRSRAPRDNLHSLIISQRQLRK